MSDKKRVEPEFSIMDEVTDSTMIMLSLPIKIKPHSKQRIHVYLTKEYRKSEQIRDNAAKCVLSVTNAMLNHDKIFLGLSRTRITEIVDKDPNWKEGKKPTVTTRNYPAILAKLQKGILAKQFDGVEGGTRTASIYRIIHKGLLGLMNLDMSQEKEWLTCAKSFHESESKKKQEKKIKTSAETNHDSGTKPRGELFVEDFDGKNIEVELITEGQYKDQYRAVKGRPCVYEKEYVFSINSEGGRNYIIPRDSEAKR